MLINEHWDYFLPRPGSTLIYSPTFFHLYRLHVLQEGRLQEYYFVSDLAERVHLVDSVSNSEQNFDIYINIRYNSDQAFLIEQYPALY